MFRLGLWALAGASLAHGQSTTAAGQPALTPPLVAEAVRAVRRKVSPERPVWELVRGGWPEVHRDQRIRGWDLPTAVEASATRARELVTANLAGRLPFGLTEANANHPAASIEFHNTAESFVHAFLSSTRMMRHASILDWGGGVGQYWEICRAVAPDLELDYHCRELPEFVRRGREIYPQIAFHDDDTWASRTYDFVFASSSLHYVEDWRRQLRNLARVAVGGRLFVTRIPVAFSGESYVFVQRPYAWGFATEYAAWCFNRNEFLDECARIGLSRAWEFVSGERAEIVGAPEVAEFRGFLFDVPRDLS